MNISNLTKRKYLFGISIILISLLLISTSIAGTQEDVLVEAFNL